MKKGRLLALTLVVAVMLVGAGYAYWSEVLTINTTVDTGELDVQFIEPANVEKESKYQPNADCTPSKDGKSMKVTFKEVYPGLENDFEFTLTNVGTLGAYVDDFKIAGHNFSNANLILCNGITIDGDPTNFEGGTLANALKYLNNYADTKGIFVDTTLDGTTYTAGSRLIKFDLEFSPKATEANFAENALYYLDISANVYQFNAKEIPQ